MTDKACLMAESSPDLVHLSVLSSCKEFWASTVLATRSNTTQRYYEDIVAS